MAIEQVEEGPETQYSRATFDSCVVDTGLEAARDLS